MEAYPSNTRITKTTNLRQMVVEADPEWPLKSQLVTEYEVSSPSGGVRRFTGRYAERGAYASE